MSEMKVLLLGWEFTPTVKEDQDNACLGMSKALGDEVNLSMILPVSDPDFILKNVALTGLNNIDLPAVEPVKPQKDYQPFAEESYVRKQIPLYGAPVQQGPERHITHMGQAEQAASAGVMHQDRGNSGFRDTIENPNFFGKDELNQMSLDTQVIQYARWVTRLAAQRKFDVIYAYDWRTFLAGSELKLVTGKPLVLQVNALGLESEDTANQGWRYQTEIQTLQKADWIIAANNRLAALLVEAYEVSPEVITSLEKPQEEPVATNVLPSADLLKDTGKNIASLSPQGKSLPKAVKSKNGEKSAKKVRDILQQVVN